MARLEQVSGEVYRVDGDRKVLLIDSDTDLVHGSGVQTVGEGSSATIVYPDGTRLELGPDSLIEKLSVGDDSRKRVALAEGVLAAEVAKQPEDRPMILATPRASIEASATRLHLTHFTQGTCVEVEDGVADVKSCAEGAAFRVNAGSYSVVGALETPRPVALRLPTRITQPQLSFPDGSGRVLAVAFSPSGRNLAAGGKDGKVRIWDMTLGADQKPMVIPAYTGQEVRSLAYSPDGKWLAAGGDARHQVKLFDPTTGNELATFSCHRTWLETLAFTSNSKTLIVAGAHGPESSRIYFWDLASRKHTGFVDGHAGGVWSLVLSRDGTTLATAGRDGVIKLWNVSTRQHLSSIRAHDQEATTLAFAPDGRALLSGSKDKSAKVWNVATGELLHTLVGHIYTIRGAAFAPDGKTVATISQDGAIRTWNVEDGQERDFFRMPGGGGGWSVAFAPDGRRLASSGTSKFIRIWER